MGGVQKQGLRKNELFARFVICHAHLNTSIARWTRVERL